MKKEGLPLEEVVLLKKKFWSEMEEVCGDELSGVGIKEIKPSLYCLTLYITGTKLSKRNSLPESFSGCPVLVIRNTPKAWA